MTRCLPCIKLNTSLLSFHRFKKRLGLPFAHLPLLFRLGLGSLHIFVWRFCRFVSASSFQVASEFPLRRFLRRGGRCRILLSTFTFSRRRRRRFIFSFARTRCFF